MSHFSPPHVGQTRAWRLSHVGDSRPSPLHRQHATSGQNRHVATYADATMSASVVRPFTVASAQAAFSSPSSAASREAV